MQANKNYKGCCCDCQTSHPLVLRGSRLVLKDHSPWGKPCSGNGSMPQPGSVRQMTNF